jgi:hypothetical protein
MKIYVELLAFGNGQMRPVEVPDDRLTDNLMENLELVFHYGQNDFQPLPFPSVSAGDVVHYEGKTYMVDLVGFSEIAYDQLEAVRGVARRRNLLR